MSIDKGGGERLRFFKHGLIYIVCNILVVCGLVYGYFDLKFPLKKQKNDNTAIS